MNDNLIELTFVPEDKKAKYVKYKTHKCYISNFDVLFSRNQSVSSDFPRVYFMENLSEDIKDIYKISYKNDILKFIKFMIQNWKLKSFNEFFIHQAKYANVSIMVKYKNYVEPLFIQMSQKNIRKFIAKSLKLGYITKRQAIDYLKFFAYKPGLYKWRELTLDLTGYELLFEKLYGKNNVNDYMRKLRAKIKKIAEDIDV